MYDKKNFKGASTINIERKDQIKTNLSKNAAQVNGNLGTRSNSRVEDQKNLHMKNISKTEIENNKFFVKSNENYNNINFENSKNRVNPQTQNQYDSPLGDDQKIISEKEFVEDDWDVRSNKNKNLNTKGSNDQFVPKKIIKGKTAFSEKVAKPKVDEKEFSNGKFFERRNENKKSSDLSREEESKNLDTILDEEISETNKERFSTENNINNEKYVNSQNQIRQDFYETDTNQVVEKFQPEKSHRVTENRISPNSQVKIREEKNLKYEIKKPAYVDKKMWKYRTELEQSDVALKKKEKNRFSSKDF